MVVLHLWNVSIRTWAHLRYMCLLGRAYWVSPTSARPGGPCCLSGSTLYANRGCDLLPGEIPANTKSSLVFRGLHIMPPSDFDMRIVVSRLPFGKSSELALPRAYRRPVVAFP